MSIIKKIFGDPNVREVEDIQRKIVAPINALELEIQKLSDEELRAKTAEFKKQLAEGKTFDDILIPAFAVVREASRRVLNMRHFDVQLIGGVILHQGKISEMRTGEGKTLVATLPVYLNALSGEGVHVVTVNDYLSRRDATWMGQLYNFLGLSVGCIQGQQISFLVDQSIEAENYLGRIKKCSRKEAYAADITYGTNNEYGFDYLRDNMVVRSGDATQRDLYYAIVDEIDSILVDEARTPLIISAPAEEAAEQYYRFARLIVQLQENEDYNVDEKMRSATLTEAGLEKMEKLLGVDNIYAEGGTNMAHHMESALRAHALFKRDRDYIVKDGEVIIVDEFTGRLMHGRRYSEGLHQAIEAKENVAIQRESQTLATVTFQNYFRMYKKLAGMTGTAATEAEEFSKIYKLEVTTVPTNQPMARKDLNDRIYKNERGKFKAVVDEIKARHEKGQPCLIGTISIEKNEMLSEFLEREGIPHQMLNAKNHEREAEIIASAGMPGAVTLATNMAGRGVDIMLGGVPPSKVKAQSSKVKTGEGEEKEEKEKGIDEEYKKWEEEHNKVVEAGGLHVIGTERHESRRIDNQLRGRSGRQGDPGSSQFYLSLEDDLMRIFGSDRMKGMMETLRVPEDMPIENRMISGAIESAQRKVEEHNFDIRKHLLDYDDVLNKQRETIYRRRKEILAVACPASVVVTESAAPVEGETAPTTRELVFDMIKKELTDVVNFHTLAAEIPSNWNLQEIYEIARTIFYLPGEALPELKKMVETAGSGKMREVGDLREEVVAHLMGKAEAEYEKLEKKIAEATKQFDAMREIEKGILLRSIDTLWVEHLDEMDHLRSGIGLRGYAQRDPLIEYKKESFRMFRELLGAVEKQVVYSIFKVGLAGEIAERSLLERQGVVLSGAQKTMSENSSNTGLPALESNKPKDADGHKVGRNDPCPCGATKSDGTPIKYKHCHGK